MRNRKEKEKKETMALSPNKSLEVSPRGKK
jgi:hypothetical protein